MDMSDVKIKIDMFVGNPLAVPLTMQITMPLEEWQKLAIDVKSNYPGWVLANAINDAINQTKDRTSSVVKQEY